MKNIALLLLIGFVAVSIFGFGFMSHSGEHATSNCIVSILDKVVCPQIGLTVALHHINAYSIFSEAIPSLFSISLMLILTLFVVGYLYLRNFLELNLRPARYKQSEPELFLYQPREITAWLSLFENSPSLS